MITPDDIIIRQHHADELDRRVVRQIAGNTANTW